MLEEIQNRQGQTVSTASPYKAGYITLGCAWQKWSIRSASKEAG